MKDIFMKYTEIDNVIKPWASSRDLKWIEYFNGEERRFLYKTNTTGESYQISIDLEDIDIATINLYSVERFEKDDVHYKWTVEYSRLESALDAALSKIDELGTAL